MTQNAASFCHLGQSCDVVSATRVPRIIFSNKSCSKTHERIIGVFRWLRDENRLDALGRALAKSRVVDGNY